MTQGQLLRLRRRQVLPIRSQVFNILTWECGVDGRDAALYMTWTGSLPAHHHPPLFTQAVPAVPHSQPILVPHPRPLAALHRLYEWVKPQLARQLSLTFRLERRALRRE